MRTSEPFDNTLPAERGAAEIWRDVEEPNSHLGTAYDFFIIAAGTLDRCGAAILAGTAVGSPFVGSVAATLALS